MNLRDLKPRVLRLLAVEGDEEFDEWFKRTGGKVFGKDEPLPIKDLWRYAYSRAMTNCLKRVDLGNFKDV
jgi:hypothetical protein